MEKLGKTDLLALCLMAGAGCAFATWIAGHGARHLAGWTDDWRLRIPQQLVSSLSRPSAVDIFDKAQRVEQEMRETLLALEEEGERMDQDAVRVGVNMVAVSRSSRTLPEKP